MKHRATRRLMRKREKIIREKMEEFPSIAALADGVKDMKEFAGFISPRVRYENVRKIVRRLKSGLSQKQFKNDGEKTLAIDDATPNIPRFVFDSIALPRELVSSVGDAEVLKKWLQEEVSPLVERVCSKAANNFREEIKKLKTANEALSKMLRNDSTAEIERLRKELDGLREKFQGLAEEHSRAKDKLDFYVNGSGRINPRHIAQSGNRTPV